MIGKNIKYYVKSSSIPAVELTDQEVSFLSQKFVVPKTIKFGDTWDVKVICTQDMRQYKSLLAWQDYYSDIRNNGGGNKVVPNVDAHVCLLDGSHQNVVKEIILKGVFPTNIPKIQMQYGNQTQIADFSCTFTYQYLYDKVDGDPLRANAR